MKLALHFLPMQILTISSMVKEKLEINDDTFIGTFVYGSQNYGLNDNDSDTDTITIVLNAKKSNQEILFNFGKAKVYTFQYFI